MNRRIRLPDPRSQSRQRHQAFDESLLARLDVLLQGIELSLSQHPVQIAVGTLKRSPSLLDPGQSLGNDLVVVGQDNGIVLKVCFQQAS